MSEEKYIMDNNIQVQVSISDEVRGKYAQGSVYVTVMVNGKKYEYEGEDKLDYSAYKKHIWLDDGDLASDLENWLETYPLELADEAYQKECLIKIKKEIRKVAEQESVQAFFGAEIGEVPIVHDNNISVWVSPGQCYSPGSPWEEVEWGITSPNNEVEIDFTDMLEGEHYDSGSALEQARDFYEQNIDNLNEDYEWNEAMSKQFRKCWEYSSRGYSVPKPGNGISPDADDFVSGFDYSGLTYQDVIKVSNDIYVDFTYDGLTVSIKFPGEGSKVIVGMTNDEILARLVDEFDDLYFDFEEERSSAFKSILEMVNFQCRPKVDQIVIKDSFSEYKNVEEDSTNTNPVSADISENTSDYDNIGPGIRLFDAPQKIAKDLESAYPDHLIVVASGCMVEARGSSVKMLDFKDWGSKSKKNNNEPRSGVPEMNFFGWEFEGQVAKRENYIVVGQKHDTKEIFGIEDVSYQTPPVRDENNQVIREVVYMKTNGVVLETAPEPEEKPSRSGFGGDKITRIENHVSIVFTYNDVDHELQYPATGNDVRGKITTMNNPEILKRLIDKLNEVEFNSDDDKEEVFESLLDMINHTCLSRKKITHKLGQKIEAVKEGVDLPIHKQSEDTFLTISENNSDLHGRVLELGDEFISSPQNIARALELQYPNHIIFIQSGKLWDVRGRSLELSKVFSKIVMPPRGGWLNNSPYINQSEPMGKWTEFHRRALGKAKIDLLMYEWNQNPNNYLDVQGIMVISQKQDQTLESYGQPVKTKDGFVVRFVEEIEGSEPITTDISEHLPATPKATNTQEESKVTGDKSDKNNNYESLEVGDRVYGSPQLIAKELEGIYPDHIVMIQSGCMFEARGKSVGMLKLKDWGSKSKKNNNEPRSGIQNWHFESFFNNNVKSIGGYIVIQQQHASPSSNRYKTNWSSDPERDEDGNVIRNVLSMSNSKVNVNPNDTDNDVEKESPMSLILQKLRMLSSEVAESSQVEQSPAVETKDEVNEGIELKDSIPQEIEPILEENKESKDPIPGGTMSLLNAIPKYRKLLSDDRDAYNEWMLNKPDIPCGLMSAFNARADFLKYVKEDKHVNIKLDFYSWILADGKYTTKEFGDYQTIYENWMADKPNISGHNISKIKVLEGIRGMLSESVYSDIENKAQNFLASAAYKKDLAKSEEEEKNAVDLPAEIIEGSFFEDSPRKLATALEERYPNYIIVIQSGCMMEARGGSVKMLNDAKVYGKPLKNWSNPTDNPNKENRCGTPAPYFYVPNYNVPEDIGFMVIEQSTVKDSKRKVTYLKHSK